MKKFLTFETHNAIETLLILKLKHQLDNVVNVDRLSVICHHEMSFKCRQAFINIYVKNVANFCHNTRQFFPETQISGNKIGS